MFTLGVVLKIFVHVRKVKVKDELIYGSHFFVFFFYKQPVIFWYFKFCEFRSILLVVLELLQHELFKTIVSKVKYTGKAIGIKEEDI